MENNNILTLSQPYMFEGEMIESLDFSGFDDITTNDMIAAADDLTRSGRVVVNPEMDIQYCLYIAACATKKPHEFFKTLRPRDTVKVKNMVRRCFFGEE